MFQSQGSTLAPDTGETDWGGGDRSTARFRYRLRRQAYRDAAEGAAGVGTALGDGQPSRKEREENAALRAEVERLKDNCLRARSDLENYRRRVTRDKEEQRKYANEELVKGLIDTVDNLERAIEGASKSHDVSALHQGVEMVHQQFLTSLRRHGVEIVTAEPGDKFDPKRHEAVMVEPNPDFENEAIIECLQSGYLLNSRVLRAAMVKVVKN